MTSIKPPTKPTVRPTSYAHSVNVISTDQAVWNVTSRTPTTVGPGTKTIAQSVRRDVNAQPAALIYAVPKKSEVIVAVTTIVIRAKSTWTLKRINVLSKSCH